MSDITSNSGTKIFGEIGHELYIPKIEVKILVIVTLLLFFMICLVKSGYYCYKLRNTIKVKYVPITTKISKNDHSSSI